MDTSQLRQKLLSPEVSESNCEEEDEDLLEEILTVLARGSCEGLTELRRQHAGNVRRFDELLAAARLYTLGLSDLKASRRAHGLLPPGTRIGDFEIVSLLGQGGMGEVYRATQHSLGDREVALKILSTQLRNVEARARFRREGLLLAGLHHVGLAEVYGFGEERGEPYLAMRLVEGVDLRTVLSEWRRTGTEKEVRIAKVVRWGTEVAEALAVVHVAGLVHRDVKPSNILIERPISGADKEGRAVLVDFGLVRSVAAETLTITGGSPATLEYAPPEQILGKSVGPAVDVFALGVTLCDALSDQVPDDRPRAAGGMRRLDEMDPDFDKDLAAVIARAVDPEPRWRYADASLLHADLLAWQKGRPVSARKLPVAERLERAIRGHPKQVLGVTLAVSAIVALFWGLMAVGTYRDSIRTAQTALERGDLSEAHASLTDVPVSWRFAAMGWTPQLDEFIERLEDDEEVGEIQPIVESLRSRDTPGALLSCAAALRRNGIVNEPMLLRWWVAGLRDQIEFEELQRRKEWSTRLQLTARLMCESPCVSLEESQAATPLRDTLISLYDDDRLSAEDRLFVVSALSGCAKYEDVTLLAGWMVSNPNESEMARLACVALDRTLARLALSEAQIQLDFSSLWEIMTDDIRSALDYAAECVQDGEWLIKNFQGYEYSLIKLMESICLAERRAEQSSLVHVVVPYSWWEELEKVGPSAQNMLISIAWSADPRVRRGVMAYAGQDREDGIPSYPGYYLGLYAALSGDVQFAQELRTHCEADRSAGTTIEMELATFDLQADRLSTTLELPDYQTNLDPPTLLGATRKPTTWKDVKLSANRLAKPGTLATWDFDRADPLATGSAFAARSKAFELDQDAYSRYLVGRLFGQSEILLEYEGTGSVQAGGAELVLRHVAAQRGSFPHGGQVYLQIRVDDRLVADGIMVVNYKSSAKRPESFTLPIQALDAGPHRISIRMDPRSNTTYRILGAELRPFDLLR